MHKKQCGVSRKPPEERKKKKFNIFILLMTLIPYFWNKRLHIFIL